jgi:hypothetical protein
MMPPPEDLSRLQAARWRRAIQTVKELSEEGVLVSASISVHDRSGCVWEARLRKKEGTYTWRGPAEADLTENTDWFSFWLEMTVTELDWNYLSTLLPSQFADAQVHLPQMTYEDGMCRAPVRGGELAVAVVYSFEAER